MLATCASFFFFFSKSFRATLDRGSDSFNFFFFFFLLLLIYLWLCWVFVSVRGLPLVVASRDHSSTRCAGPSPSRPLLLRSTGSRRTGSVVVAHGPSRSTACGILPDQGSNPCPLHWQADSQPLRHQGSPHVCKLLSKCPGSKRVAASQLHLLGQRVEGLRFVSRPSDQ